MSDTTSAAAPMYPYTCDGTTISLTSPRTGDVVRVSCRAARAALPDRPELWEPPYNLAASIALTRDEASALFSVREGAAPVAPPTDDTFDLEAGPDAPPPASEAPPATPSDPAPDAPPVAPPAPVAGDLPPAPLTDGTAPRVLRDTYGPAGLCSCGAERRIFQSTRPRSRGRVFASCSSRCDGAGAFIWLSAPRPTAPTMAPPPAPVATPDDPAPAVAGPVAPPSVQVPDIAPPAPAPTAAAVAPTDRSSVVMRIARETFATSFRPECTAFDGPARAHEEAIALAQHIKAIAGEPFLSIEYDIPDGMTNVPNPSGDFWRIGARSTKSVWLVPQKFWTDPLLTDHVNLWRSAVGPKGERVRFEITPIVMRAEDVRAKAARALDEELRRAHTALIESIAEASTRFQVALSKAQTSKEQRTAEVRHVGDLRGALKRSAEYLERAVVCAENYDLTDDASTLVEGLRAACRSLRDTVNAEGERLGVSGAGDLTF